jgi:hypothetical protein
LEDGAATGTTKKIAGIGTTETLPTTGFTIKAIAVDALEGSDNIGEESGLLTAVYTLAVAPGSVTNVSGTIVDGSAYLTWTNPTDTDFVKVNIKVGEALQDEIYADGEGVVPNYALVDGALMVNDGFRTTNDVAFTFIAEGAHENKTEKEFTISKNQTFDAYVDAITKDTTNINVGKVALTSKLVTAIFNKLSSPKGYTLNLSESLVLEDDSPTFSSGNKAYVTNLILPASLEKLDSLKFTEWTRLTSVSGAGLTEIGEGAFERCIALTSVNFPLVDEIKSKAFLDCIALTSMSLPLAGSIAAHAFENCTTLRSVNFPKVYTIGQAAFLNCAALTSMSLPLAGSIGQSAFENCTSLRSVDFTKVYTIGQAAFLNGSPISIKLGSNPPTLPDSKVWSTAVKFRVPERSETAYGSWSNAGTAASEKSFEYYAGR